MRITISLIMLIAFISYAIESDQNAVPETGTIIGRVAYAYIHELYGDEDSIEDATVTLEGTRLGSMTDSTGSFIIREVPVGSYILQAFYVGFIASSPISIRLAGGDTVDVGDIYISPGFPGPVHIFQWPSFQETIQVRVIFKSMDNSFCDAERVQFMTYYDIVPSTRIDDRIYSVSIPVQTESFYCRIPRIRELGFIWEFDSFAEDSYIVDMDCITIDTSILMDHPSDNLRSCLDSPDEWISDAYSAQHEYYDITKWGDSSLINWGYIGSNVHFEENGERTILIGYHHQAVFMHDGISPIVHEFAFPVKIFQCSSNGRFVLAFEAIGYLFRGGNAELINMLEGTSVCFDPTPDSPVPERAVGSETIVLGCTSPSCFLIGNDGNLVGVGENSLYYYNEDCSLNRLLLLDDISLIYNSWNNQSIVMMDNRILALGSPEDNQYALVYFNRGGHLNDLIEPEFRYASGILMMHDFSDNARYAILSIIHDTSTNLTTLLDTETGAVLREWEERAKQSVFSPSGNLVCSIFQYDLPPRLSLYSTENLEEILSIPDLPGRVHICGISDNGNILIRFVGIEGSFLDYSRYVLLDVNGDPIWLSPKYISREDEVPVLSEDGTRLSYMDGRYLHLITFSDL